MKKLFLILFISLVSGCLLGKDLIDNTPGVGTIVNGGWIRVKTVGTIRGLQDTIGGTVVYQANQGGVGQIIPNICYNRLMVTGGTSFRIDSLPEARANSRPMSVLDSFICKTGFANIKNDKVETVAKGDVWSNSKIQGSKDVVMGGNKKQDINGADGLGSFSRLRIENSAGVDVKGEFAVVNKLELKEGELRNSQAAVRIGERFVDRSDTNDDYRDRPQIIRHTTGSITDRPVFVENTVDVVYTGGGSMRTGKEIPAESDSQEVVIYGLRIENTDSLVLTENVRATDNLYIGTHTHTTELDTLTLSSEKNPEFFAGNPDAEVHGHFRRTGWRTGDTIVFNNPYTKLFFNTNVDRSEISSLVSTIFPGRFSSQPQGSFNKVRRGLSLRAYNSNGEEYTKHITATYNYGWRHDGLRDETGFLAFEKLLLLHYNGTSWMDNQTSVRPPSNNSLGHWGFSYAVQIDDFGDFAIGMQPSRHLLAFSGKALLEGAYRYSDGRMSNELQEKNYLPMPPPDIYPYNTDENRLNYIRPNGQFPDSVVDWVVLEFRKDFSIPGPRKTMLLKTDGRIVDMWGNEEVFFKANENVAEILPMDSNGVVSYDTLGDDLAQVFVLILHRNHAAVISNLPIAFTDTAVQFVDMSLPKNIFSGVEALKPIDRISGSTTQYIYGMIAGDINYGLEPDGDIDEYDYDQLIGAIANWSIETLDGYLLNDINLSGTITSLDFNLIFNNRNKHLWYKR
jgi:hypothetical protein